MKLVNVGCGATFHPSWVNLDLVSLSPLVQAYDIRKGLPFEASSVDACYSSHVLEHLSHSAGQVMVAEFARVIKPKGIMRIVVPDLEGIVRAYFCTLEQVDAGNRTAIANYDWMILELIDQLTRCKSGGEMLDFLTNPALSNQEFILSRIGLEANRAWEYNSSSQPTPSLWQRLRTKKVNWFLQQFKADSTFRKKIAEKLVVMVAGKETQISFNEGLFFNTGENHRWMYDRFSLRRLLEQAGFSAVQSCRADESRIPGFASYNLDMVEGQVRKPDSLFMEGIKA